MLSVLLWPIVACVLLPWLFVYLGLHVVQRVRGSVRDAIIALVLVAAAAGLALWMDRAAAPDDQMRAVLFGNLIALRARDLWACFRLFVVIGLIQYWQRRSFLLVTFDRARAHECGLRTGWWDTFFYVTLAIILVMTAPVAGVLPVVSILVVPALIAMFLTRRIALRLLIGSFVAALGGIGGLCVAFYRNVPSGVAIVCTLGVLLVIFGVATLFRRKPDRLVS